MQCIAVFAIAVIFCGVADAEESTVAYFLQVSETTLPLLPRLLRNIWHAENYYVVHFDAKISTWQRDYTILSILKSLPHRENVIIMPSEVITYRGISMAINTMNGMQVAIDAGDWDYFINISGADYPLVSPEKQRELLYPFSKHNSSFLAIAPQTWAKKALEYRASRLFTDTSLAMSENNSKLIDSGINHPLHSILGFEFAAAEAWMMLHRSFVEYMLKAPKARRYFAAFAYIAEPEEHLFPTVAVNTPQFNNTLIHDAMRAVFWKSPTGQKAGQHPFHIDERDEDGKWIFLDSLRKSGVFFARKVSKRNSPLLDIIDSQLSGVAEHDVDSKLVQDYLAVVERRLRVRGARVFNSVR